MLERSVTALENLKHTNPSFRQIQIVPPQMTFSQGNVSLRVGKKNLILSSTPGHSADSISVFIEEDRVLFAGDAFMPLPYIVDGDIEESASTIKRFGKMGLENIIQGHGDIILRGEIETAVKENLAYLTNIRRSVKSAAKRRNPVEALSAFDIESCGKNRVYLGGLAEELHKRNLRVLLKQILEETSEDSSFSNI